MRLISEADGCGGIEFFDYDLENRRVTVKRLGFKGETTQEFPVGEQ